MNIRFLNILGLFSCLLFLAANIFFDMIDKPEYPANPKIYYVPLGIMTFCLVLLAYEHSKKESPIIKILWWFFLVMAMSQLVKLSVTNPQIYSISEYSFLTIALVGVVIKVFKIKN